MPPEWELDPKPCKRLAPLAVTCVAMHSNISGRAKRLEETQTICELVRLQAHCSRIKTASGPERAKASQNGFCWPTLVSLCQPLRGSDIHQARVSVSDSCSTVGSFQARPPILARLQRKNCSEEDSCTPTSAARQQRRTNECFCGEDERA